MPTETKKDTYSYYISTEYHDKFSQLSKKFNLTGKGAALEMILEQYFTLLYPAIKHPTAIVDLKYLLRKMEVNGYEVKPIGEEILDCVLEYNKHLDGQI